MKYPFYTCDVFTSDRFGGNPLAVITRAEGLTTVQMQNIAREFNYSETSFVLPPEAGATRKVRIFTPSEEIPIVFSLQSIGYLLHYTYNRKVKVSVVVQNLTNLSKKTVLYIYNHIYKLNFSHISSK